MKRPYDQARDVPRTGWDALAINTALQSGTALYVEQNGEIWTQAGEYIGRCCRKEEEVAI